jgi:hypothetical protein
VFFLLGASDLSELQSFGALTGLIDLKLAGNPVCQKPGYMTVARKHLTSLDTLDTEALRVSDLVLGS